MKKLTTKLAAAMLLLTTTMAAQADLNIFACEPEWGSLAKELAPEADIYTATTAFQDPHNIQARPSLLAKARQADLLICAGAELEIGWLPILLRRTGNAAIQPGEFGYFMAAELVERLEVPENLSLLDRSMGDVHASGNPHVHLDPRRVQTIAGLLSARLQLIDPANTAQYEQTLASFNQRWAAKITEWEAAAAPLRGQSIVVHHRNWTYLTDWLGISTALSLEPKPGIPPSASHVRKVIAQLKAKPVMAIIYGPAADDRAANRVNKATGIPQAQLPYTVGAGGANDLFDLFDITIRQLLALKQP